MDISKKNYFQLFSFDESFQVEVESLDQAYKALQALYHPDKVVNSNAAERLQALQISSILNDAYTTLKSPLKRAAYLLTLHDVDPEENNQAHLGSDFLFKQIELREHLETLSQREDIDGLEEFKLSIEKEVQSYLNGFEQHYLQKNYTDAKPVYSKLQFLYKLLSEIDTLEESLLGY